MCLLFNMRVSTFLGTMIYDVIQFTIICKPRPMRSEFNSVLSTVDTGPGNKWMAGKVYQGGDLIRSAGGRYELRMQTDGNFVLGDRQMDETRYSSNTYNFGGSTLRFQNDGNLVMLDTANNLLWTSSTNGNDNIMWGILDDTGYFTMYAHDPTNPLFGSATIVIGKWLLF